MQSDIYIQPWSYKFGEVVLRAWRWIFVINCMKVESQSLSSRFNFLCITINVKKRGQTGWIINQHSFDGWKSCLKLEIFHRDELLQIISGRRYFNSIMLSFFPFSNSLYNTRSYSLAAREKCHCSKWLTKLIVFSQKRLGHCYISVVFFCNCWKRILVVDYQSSRIMHTSQFQTIILILSNLIFWQASG